MKNSIPILSAMEHEFNVTGFIFKKTPGAMDDITALDHFQFDNHSFSLKHLSDTRFGLPAATFSASQDIDENYLTQLCEHLSKTFQALVYIYKDHEVYGNANVFNGGSDYEVVEEYCFFCAFDNGQQKFKEHTDGWNATADALEKSIFSTF